MNQLNEPVKPPIIRIPPNECECECVNALNTLKYDANPNPSLIIVIVNPLYNLLTSLTLNFILNLRFNCLCNLTYSIGHAMNDCREPLNAPA